MNANKLERRRLNLKSAYDLACSEVPQVRVTPGVLDGKPRIGDSRTPVALVLRVLAAGDDPKEDVGVTEKDIRACLMFAAEVCDQPTDDA